MTVPMLRLSAADRPGEIEARREGGVPDDFWLRAAAEWGAAGPAPDVAVLVPLERFVGRLDWLVPACRAHGVGVAPCDRVRALLEGLRADDERWQEDLRGPRRIPDAALDAVLARGRFRRPLRPPQRDNVARLLAVRHGAELSVPGAGKTAVAAAVYEAHHGAGEVAQMLVVAPLAAHDAWLEEARRWFDPPPRVARFDGTIDVAAEWLLVNYHRLTAAFAELAAWVAARPTLLVMDEAHKLKRGRCGAWGACGLDLAVRARRRLALTGTPAPHALTDLAALAEFLYPGRGRLILPPAWLADDTPASARRVADRLRPLFVRTTKPQLGLDPPDYHVVRRPLAGAQADLYRALLGVTAAALGDGPDLRELGQSVMRLLMAATNPALLSPAPEPAAAAAAYRPPRPAPPGTALAELLRRYDVHETPWKYRKAAQLVDQVLRRPPAPRRGRREVAKVIVWSCFPENLRRLAGLLARFEPAVIHGRVPSEVTQPAAELTRERELDRFRNDDACRVLLANPSATGEGVSLHTACHDAIYLDRIFAAATYWQSVDRIHRLGLEPGEATNVWVLISAGTIDEEVERRLAAKTRRLARLLDDPDLVPMALPDGDDEEPDFAALDEGDLAALFAHLRGDDAP